MKKFFMTLSLAIVTMAAMAVPAKPGVWKTLKLADGTEVRAQLKGDEHGHFWLAEDGKAYLEVDDTDVFQMVDMTSIKEQAKVRRQRVNEQRTRRLAKRRASSSGFFDKKKGIVILVNFKDTKFKTNHDNALFTRIANEEGYNDGNFYGSIADYFKAQSGGKFELDFDVVGPVLVSQNVSHYGSNDSQGNDMYAAEMVCEAVEKAMKEVADWKQYDWDNDGEVDQVYVIYAGKGEADSGVRNTIWPHAYNLSDANFYGDGSGPVTVGTNLVVNTYACGSELNGSGKIEGNGTMCHEFSHCLGYPDFYDTDYSGGQGMGYWDLMDSGCYNGGGYIPAGYTGYERWVAGWLTPIVLEEEDVTIENMKSLQEGGDFYIIYNKGNRNEYFMLENRQQINWDQDVPASGLLIVHTDYNARVWNANEPNQDPEHQRMTVVPADGEYQSEPDEENGRLYYWEGMVTDPFPQDGVTAFNKDFKTYDDIAKKAAKFFNKNSNNTYYIDSSVEDITQNADGTISFNYVANYASSSGDDPAVTPTGDNLFYESFNQCAGTGGNDGLWSGTIASATFQPDNEGWVVAGDKAYGANKCAKFGTSSEKGSATTPPFMVNGEAILTFRAGAWNHKEEGQYLTISVDNGTISEATTRAGSSNSITVEMEKGAFKDYTLIINASKSVTVTFETQNAKNRFFLDEVLVVDPNSTTGISPVTRQPSSLTDAWYTLDGRKLTGKPTLKGIYIFNGKKVVVEK